MGSFPETFYDPKISTRKNNTNKKIVEKIRQMAYLKSPMKGLRLPGTIKPK